MTSVLKKSRGSKGKSESMQEDLPSRWGNDSRGKEDVGKLIKNIDDSVIGKGNSFCGPYGRRKGNNTFRIYFNYYFIIFRLPTCCICILFICINYFRNILLRSLFTMQEMVNI